MSRTQSSKFSKVAPLEGEPSGPRVTQSWPRVFAASTWYEPLADQPSIDLAVYWALARPGIFVITTGDVHLLPKVLDAAERFSGQAPSQAAMQALVDQHHMEPLFV